MGYSQWGHKETEQLSTHVRGCGPRTSQPSTPRSPGRPLPPVLSPASHSSRVIHWGPRETLTRALPGHQHPPRALLPPLSSPLSLLLTSCPLRLQASSRCPLLAMLTEVRLPRGPTTPAATDSALASHLSCLEPSLPWPSSRCSFSG